VSYFYGEAGTKCDSPLANVETIETCKQAAALLGGIYGGSGDFPVPFGCVADLKEGGYVYFNTRLGKPAVNHRRPICSKLENDKPRRPSKNTDDADTYEEMMKSQFFQRYFSRFDSYCNNLPSIMQSQTDETRRCIFFGGMGGMGNQLLRITHGMFLSLQLDSTVSLNQSPLSPAIDFVDSFQFFEEVFQKESALTQLGVSVNTRSCEFTGLDQADWNDIMETLHSDVTYYGCHMNTILGKPTRQIMNYMRPYWKKIGSDRLLSVHIRFGDANMKFLHNDTNLQDRVTDDRKVNVEELLSYVPCIVKEMKDYFQEEVKVFITSDSPSTVEPYVEKLTSQGIRLVRQIHDESIPIHVNDGLRMGTVKETGRSVVSDWFMLTMSDALLLASHSSFSHTAKLAAIRPKRDSKCVETCAERFCPHSTLF